MKYFVKKSVLLLLVVLAFCACDNSNDNGEVIQPKPQSSKSVVNYTGEVEFVVDAPQIREDIEQVKTSSSMDFPSVTPSVTGSRETG